MFKPLPVFIGLRYAGAQRRNGDTGGLVSFISGLSMVGLILGVALMIVVMSVMNGFDRELRERILGIMPHATIYNSAPNIDWPAVRDQLAADPEVVAAAEVWQINALARQGSAVAPLLVQGINPDTIVRVSNIDRFVTPAAFNALADSAEPGIILGKGIAEKLDVRVGEHLSLIVPSNADGEQDAGGRHAARLAGFVVADIFHSGTELDQSLALVSWDQASALAGGGSGAGVQLRFQEMLAANWTLRRLLKDLPAQGFYGTDWSSTHGNLYQAIQMSRNLVGLLVLLIIAIAAFNVVSTLVMVVIDKHADIAILRTMGASTREILLTFVSQGALVGLVGALFGGLLGIMGALTVTDLVAGLESLLGIQFLKSDVYPVDYLPSELQWGDVALVVGAGFLLSLLATLYPALQASRVQPAAALRNEQ
ncbi:lipoprotein-releasing ABC transporter permease subunit [Microbulbifer thermotolerans]|uniref:Lipoprotein-releasing ABC transporter permease subunit n=1 Tax=Microbulbifer thermotolerans TaxID=252514 RepID=A0AB35HW32_MICTH|nr:lipoprotein-releasing ABC transporter permease subunit [Microbulbifer thermotolerans]MCX2800450.1 lipoprotein-releasing ABC transporter permease subunit [Microbulbifer thermotolerans]MCX2831074.1 lipoprotein-releasing ABC transporter permease subunit [Microbulbifer thermotolerans]